MQATERSSYGINNMNRSLVRSSPQSYGQLHNETYLLYMKPNTFITRNRSRVRRSPQSYGRLLNEAHPLYTKIKAFIHRRHRRVRSSPRSYGHLRIPPDASSTHSCPSPFRLFPIAFPFGPRPSPHMKQNVQRCVFLQKRLRRRDSSTQHVRLLHSVANSHYVPT